MAVPTLSNQFVAGYGNPVQFQAIGQGQVSTLNIFSQTWEEEVLNFIVTSVSHNGVQARLAGPIDGKGTVTAKYDLLNPPYLSPPLILAGVSGVMLFFIGPARAYQAPVIITKVHWEGGTQTEVSWNFDVSMNANAGLYIRPTT